MADVTVLIPVGPAESHKHWLPECLSSVRGQLEPASEIFIMSDGAGISGLGSDVRIWEMPCVTGPVTVMNVGVALASNPLVIFLGSDDILRPWCIRDAIQTYQKCKDDLGYYWFDVEYSDGRIQKLASGPAMVTKALWRHTGGYPKESCVGAPDHIFISAMLAAGSNAGRLHQVQSSAPPYWYRVHSDQGQQTQNAKFGSVIGLVRDIISVEWIGKYR